MYFDFILLSLSAAAREELQAMDPDKYVYRSDFAKRYFGQGMAEGQIQGRVEILATQLVQRFGRLSATWRQRLAAASAEQINVYARRVLTAKTIDEVFAPVSAITSERPAAHRVRPSRRHTAEK